MLKIITIRITADLHDQLKAEEGCKVYTSYPFDKGLHQLFTPPSNSKVNKVV